MKGIPIGMSLRMTERGHVLLLCNLRELVRTSHQTWMKIDDAGTPTHDRPCLASPSLLAAAGSRLCGDSFTAAAEAMSVAVVVVLTAVCSLLLILLCDYLLKRRWRAQWQAPMHPAIASRDTSRDSRSTGETLPEDVVRVSMTRHNVPPPEASWNGSPKAVPPPPAEPPPSPPLARAASYQAALGAGSGPAFDERSVRSASSIAAGHGGSGGDCSSCGECSELSSRSVQRAGTSPLLIGSPTQLTDYLSPKQQQARSFCASGRPSRLGRSARAPGASVAQHSSVRQSSRRTSGESYCGVDPRGSASFPAADGVRQSATGGLVSHEL